MKLRHMHLDTKEVLLINLSEVQQKKLAKYRRLSTSDHCCEDCVQGQVEVLDNS